MGLSSWLADRRAERKRRRIEERRREKEAWRYLKETAFGAVVQHISKHYAVTCPQGVVLYMAETNIGSILTTVFSESRAKIDSKIREILATNPNANLRSYEQALGVKFLRFDRANGTTTHFGKLDSGNSENNSAALTENSPQPPQSKPPDGTIRAGRKIV